MNANKRLFDSRVPQGGNVINDRLKTGCVEQFQSEDLRSVYIILERRKVFCAIVLFMVRMCWDQDKLIVVNSNT